MLAVDKGALECEIDDMNPQIFGLLMDRLLAEGALDVFYTSIQMKKNRPGTLLTIVAAPEARGRLTASVFRESPRSNSRWARKSSTSASKRGEGAACSGERSGAAVAMRD